MEDNVAATLGRRAGRKSTGAWRLGLAWLIGAALALSAAPALAEAAPQGSEIDGEVYIGAKVGYGGTGMYPVWSSGVPEGEPDYWAYCIEHDVAAKTSTLGQVGDLESYLGANHFLDEAVQQKVLWVLAHSYPAVSLADFAAAVGVPDMLEQDAIEGAQYAIWRYTELSFDAAWSWETEASEAAYWYLVDGANAAGGLAPEYFEVTATVEASTEPQVPGSLIGPFTVRTNQERVSVSTDSSLTLVDEDGNAIDAANVVDGQRIFLDARAETTAGSATVTVSASGTSNTGKVISVPTAPGATPTEGDHAQSVILVTPETTKTTDSAHLAWEAVVETPEPTTEPTPGPSTEPTPGPSTEPTPGPSTEPTPGPSTEPTPGPSTEPTPGPSAEPAPGPSTEPTPGPSTEPTPGPSTEPTPGPSTEPTPGPSTEPTPTPSTEPTPGPSTVPTPGPSTEPTPAPSVEPTPGPSTEPTQSPSEAPAPSAQPTPLSSADPTPQDADPEPTPQGADPEPTTPAGGSPQAPAPRGPLAPTGGSAAGAVAGTALIALLAGGSLMLLRRRARHQV